MRPQVSEEQIRNNETQVTYNESTWRRVGTKTQSRLIALNYHRHCDQMVGLWLLLFSDPGTDVQELFHHVVEVTLPRSGTECIV